MNYLKKILIILFVITISIFIAVDKNVKALEIAQDNNVEVTFTDGDLTVNETTIDLFDDFTRTSTTDISSNLVIPNVSFSEITIKDQYNTSDIRLDVETFVFAENHVYSFTGWHVVGTTEYLPANTVFQSGDVVLNSILQTIVTDNDQDGTYELKLEAVWGRCYFIRNPYENMVYSLKDGIYTLDTELSTNPTGASDANDGLTKETPKATIDGLFSLFRQNIYVDKTQDAHNAYLVVVMLIGELHYYKDSNISSGFNIYGKATAGNSDAFVSCTYKSLQVDGIAAYNYYYKPRGYYNAVYSNMRLDNVNFLKAVNIFDKQSVGSEFQLYQDPNNKNKTHYFESTTRFNVGFTSGSSAIYTFRPDKTDIVSLNGGTFGSLHTTYSSNINKPSSTIKWYIGRLAQISSQIHCGVTSAYESNKATVNVNFELNITGGKIAGDIYGGSRGINSVANGSRTINVYGNGSTTAGEYNPSIRDIIGGAEQAKLYGDITINAKNAKIIRSIYGGGDKYTATTYGNININLDNCKLSGDLFGGGKNANSEKYNGHGGDVSINLLNTTVEGNIFGSGIGMSQSIEVADTIYSYGAGSLWWDKEPYYPADWLTPLNNYPAYDNTTGYVLIGMYKTITWSSQSVETLTFKYNYIRAYLSLATVENVVMNIESCTVGTNSNGKGNIYGGGSIAKVLGDTEININNSTVYGSVYGGGDGVSVPEKVELYSPIQDGYTAPTYKVDEKDSKGKAKKVTISSQSPAYNDSKYVIGDYSWSNDISILDLATPGVDHENKRLYSPNTDGLGSVLGNTNVILNNTKVLGTVYGGGNKGVVFGNTNVTVNGTSNLESVYAGSNQANIEQNATLTINSGTINKAYGGNNASGIIAGNVTIEVSAGNITNLYGGGNRADDDYNSTIVIKDGTINYAFGGGEQAKVGSTSVTVQNGTITNLYGGGDAGDVTTSSTLIIENGTITNAYGGGKQAKVNNTSVTVLQGEITSLYGGGDAGDVIASSTLTLENGNITTAFGGGKQAQVNSTSVTITGGTVETVYGGGDAGDTLTKALVTITGGNVTTAYGGANQANIGLSTQDENTTNVEMNIESNIETVFGGNNLSGNIYGNISLVINGSTHNEIYGGGNQADFNGTTSMEIINVTAFSLYGGGYDAYVEKVQMEINNGTYNVVYGGGNQGDTKTVLIDFLDGTINSNLFGGGNQGDVTDTTVTLSGGTINKNLYGGGFEGNVLEDVIININIATINGNVYGGGFAGTANTTTLSIIDGAEIDKFIKIEGDVFGGGEGETATVYVSTTVTINLNLNLTVSENKISDSDISGQAKITPTIHGDYSYIGKSVYGGGDLGQLGIGTINTANNSANIVQTATSIVTIVNGYIGQSVFGGGNGTPPQGIAYNVNMGTIFGSTITNVYGGYIGENVYGGGRQSRLYAKDSDATAVTLGKEEVQSRALPTPIYIKGSVFGGGDRGTNATSNASVPTTIGNANVNIIGNATATQIYFENGGVYGDGNLCLVRGTRRIFMENFTTGEAGMLKTFFSLQRADIATLVNTDLVLLGAVDLVEEGDSTIYSINRIGQLNLEQGSTIKLDSIVKGLGALTSDVQINRNFINTELSNFDPLSDTEIDEYRTNTTLLKNKVCVANGQYLEVKDEEGVYGPVKGNFTLELLFATPGEGGGFVYASIPESTGDFICETKYSYLADSKYMPVVDSDNDNENNHYWLIQGNFIPYKGEITAYIGSEVTEYTYSVIIPAPDKNMYYMLEELESSALLALVDGPDKLYDLVQENITATHNGQEIAVKFMLGSVELGFLAVDDGKFVIKTEHGNVAPYGSEQTPTSNNILQKYNPSLGNTITVLFYKSREVNNEQFGIDFNFVFRIYTLEDEYNVTFTDNESTSFAVDSDSFPNYDASNIQISDKHWYVNGNPTGLKLTIDGDYTTSDIKTVTRTQVYKQYNETNQLIFNLELNIIRLVPVETIFIGLNEQYSGVSLSDTIAITKGSSFTIEYQTKYIPSAFPYILGSATMTWELTLDMYEFYGDELGNFMTLDKNGNVINISSTLQYIKPGSDETIDNKKIQVYYDDVREVYYYNYIDENDNNVESVFTKNHYQYNNPLPKGTKIILIDYTNERTPEYFYYICDAETLTINLLDFCQMGSTTKIRNMSIEQLPAFMSIYHLKGSTRITERLVFMFDFDKAIWNNDAEVFNGNITLRHMYSSVDIMDYVKSTDEGFIREYPRTGEFTVGLKATGINDSDLEGIEGSFIKETYTTAETAQIEVIVEKSSAYVNTQLADGELAIVIAMRQGVFPNGITFEYNNKHFPAYGNTYVVIPILYYGKHIIAVNNILGTIETEIGKDTLNSTFKITLCHLVGDEHFGLFESRDNNNNGIDDYTVITPPVTTIVDKPIFSLSIDVEEHIVKQGNNVIVSFTTRCNKPSNEITRGEIHNAAGIVDPTTFMSKYVIEDNKYVITLKEDVEPGVYRIKIIYADKSEYVTIIITDKDS